MSDPSCNVVWQGRDAQDKSPANDGDPPCKRARLAAPPRQIDSATQLQMDTIMQLCEEKVGGHSGQLNPFHLV